MTEPLAIVRGPDGKAAADFRDACRQRCQAHEGAHHGNPVLWLAPSPICLTQANAAALLPLLQRFAETGSIAPAPPWDGPRHPD